MRELTPEEVAQYILAQKRNPELNLPEAEKSVMGIEFTRQGPTTLARFSLNDEIRLGWSVYSPIDRKNKKPDRPDVGETVAFNRAIKSPIIWA